MPDLQRLLDEAIRGVLDIDLFNAELRAEEQDTARLAAIKKAICGQFAGQNWDMAY